MESTAPYRSRVAAEVRAEMARQQVTASQLTATSGIPGATLSRRLNGVSPFDVDELAAIADVLAVNVAQFLPPHLRAVSA